MPDDAFSQHQPRFSVASTRHRSRSVNHAILYGTLLVATMLHSCRVSSGQPATRPTTRPVDNSPMALTVRKYRDLLRAQKLDEAALLIAASPAPVRDVDRRLKRLATALGSGAWDFIVLESRADGDAAIVIINDYLKDGRKTIDLKSWFLIRQNGDWKLLGKYTDYELKEYAHTREQIDAFRRLEEWSERRQPQLRREQPDCGC